MDVITFTGEIREENGKGKARQARAGGRIPGVLYGAQADTIGISVDRKETERVLRHLVSHNVMADLVLKKSDSQETIKTIVKEIQIEPVTREILHIDFYRIRMDKPVTMEIPVHLTGESIGVKQGGILDHGLRELKIEALPANLPDKIDVDISALNIGDALLVKDIKLPETVRVIDDAERVVIAVLAPTKEEEPEVAEVAVTEEVPTQPEVISAEKVEERRKAKEERATTEEKEKPDKKEKPEKK